MQAEKVSELLYLNINNYFTRKKTIFSDSQKFQLEFHFEVDENPDKETLDFIAESLRLTSKSIGVSSLLVLIDI